MDQSQNLIQEIWESDLLQGFKILESSEDESSEVDGKYILAKVTGPAFFPNTTSKNRVFYPQAAWESAIGDPNFLRRLNARLVYGTIGHEIELNDDTIREGKFSHIVTNVWIDENNVGQAEYLVLNTAPGVILNTLLRVKSKLRVSTKAAGFFESGPNRDGSKVIIPSTFKLERIDFVTEPGYLNALPELIESYNKDHTNNPLKEISMDNTKVVEILESRVIELKAEKSISESVVQQLNTDIVAIKQANAVSGAILESYQAIGTAAAIHEAYAELEQYRAIGSVQDIHEAFDQGEETIDTMTGTIKDLTDELEEDDDSVPTSDYGDLGSPEEVKTALDQALQIADELQRYNEIGTVEEVEAIVQNAATMTETLEGKEREAMCTKYSVSTEVLGTMMGKGMSLMEADALLAQIKGVTSGVTPPPNDIPSGEVVPEDAPAEVPELTDEEKEAKALADAEAEKDKEKDPEAVHESLSSRLMRVATRKVQPEAAPIKESLNRHTSLAARLMSRR